MPSQNSPNFGRARGAGVAGGRGGGAGRSGGAGSPRGGAGCAHVGLPSVSQLTPNIRKPQVTP